MKLMYCFLLQPSIQQIAGSERVYVKVVDVMTTDMSIIGSSLLMMLYGCGEQITLAPIFFKVR